MDNSIRMLALKPFPYMGRQLDKGDDFYATPVDARYLEKHGKAEDAPFVHAHVERAPVEPEVVTEQSSVEESAAAADAKDAGDPQNSDHAVTAPTTNESPGLLGDQAAADLPDGMKPAAEQQAEQERPATRRRGRRSATSAQS